MLDQSLRAPVFDSSSDYVSGSASFVPFVNPSSQRELTFLEGCLYDTVSKERFEVINGIPRFCHWTNYADSFGFQWNEFRRTQIDKFSGSDQSEQRFFSETSWSPRDLDNCSVLEVGSGAGRFSEVFLRTTRGLLHSIDYSNAVEANACNNFLYRDRFRLAQASIYELPFPDDSFDRIFCLGVLQHTPSFEGAVQALVRKAKVGGEIVVDFYPLKGWYTKIHSKYLLRPLVRRFSKAFLLRIIRVNITWMMRFFDLLCAVRLGVLTRFIPITDLRNLPAGLTVDQRREWAVMDTFDGLSPRYDNPQRIEDVVRMFSVSGCKVTFSGLVDYPGGSAMVVRAVKSSDLNQADSRVHG